MKPDAAFCKLSLGHCVFETLEVSKVTHGVVVKLLYLLKSFVAKLVLKVSKVQSSELWPLEEVFSLVSDLGHCKNLLSERRSVTDRARKL